MVERTEVPPRDKATEGIRAYIAEHGLKGGDQLPPERELCQAIGVSRTTLRGAVAQLISQNILESRQGSGTYLCLERSMCYLGKTYNYTEAVRNAGRVPGARTVSAGLVEATLSISEKLDIPEGSPVFVLRRVRTADGEPTCIETSYVNRELCPGIEDHDFENASLYGILDAEYGVRVSHTSERINVVAVNEWEAELLGVEQGTPAFLQRGLEKNDDMVSVEYFRSIILPSRYRLAMSYEVE